MIDRRVAEVGGRHRRTGIHALDALLKRTHIVNADEIGFRQEDAVGEPHLFLGLVVRVELRHRVLRINHRDHGIQQVVVADVVVDEKRLRHWRWIGEAGGLDDHPVEVKCAGRALGEQFSEDADEIATHGAADATVIHLDDLLAGVLHQQFVVDASFAELVLDHCDALSVRLSQDAVE